jgi:hypothetical protein
MTDEYRECPYCAEQIKKYALKCRHCYSHLSDQDTIGKSQMESGLLESVANNNATKNDINSSPSTSKSKSLIKAIVIAVPILLVSVAIIYMFNMINKGSGASGSFNVVKGLFDVSITLPASMFEGDDIDEVIREAKGNGIKNVVVNRDGSLTYTMSKATHNRITNELKEGFIESLEDMKSGNDFKSIHDVKYDGKLTKFTLTVDKEAFENSFDGFAIFGIGLMSMYYQVYSGVDVDKWSATIEIKDRYSGKVFRTTNYPGDLEGDDDQL